jgi:hypothetical protein
MEIKRAGSQSSNNGPADWFTGTVRIDPLFEAREYVVAASDRAITCQPADVRGARTDGLEGFPARSWRDDIRLGRE